MEFLQRLATQLPTLRNQIQLTGVIILVAGVIITRTLEPSAVLGQLATGSIGILVIIFGTATPVLRILPLQQRAIVLIAMMATLLILVIALAIITVDLMTKSTRANELQTQITDHLTNKYCSHAEVEAAELLELDPTNWMSYNLSARAKHCLGKWKEAIADWETAAKLSPNNFKVMFNIGAGLLDWACEECPRRSEKITSDLIAVAPDDVDLRFNLALAQALNFDYENSSANADLTLQRGLPNGSFLLGITTFISDAGSTPDERQLREIVDIFREAERQEPQYICMLLGGQNVSNPYYILIERARSSPAFHGLVEEMRSRGWGSTC